MQEIEQQIMEAARRLFLHYGFRKTSVDQIAQEAQVGKGTIYNYFKNKEDLFRRVLEFWKSQAEQHEASTRPAQSSVYELILHRIQSRISFWRNMLNGAPVTESMMKEMIDIAFSLSDTEQSLQREMEEWMQKGIVQGELDSTLDLKRTTQLLCQIEYQFVPRWMAHADNETVQQEIATLHELLWQGLGNKNGPPHKT
jgi:AcrR family transcriptional regulator